MAAGLQDYNRPSIKLVSGRILPPHIGPARCRSKASIQAICISRVTRENSLSMLSDFVPGHAILAQLCVHQSASNALVKIASTLVYSSQARPSLRNFCVYPDHLRGVLKCGFHVSVDVRHCRVVRELLQFWRELLEAGSLSQRRFGVVGQQSATTKRPLCSYSFAALLSPLETSCRPQIVLDRL